MFTKLFKSSKQFAPMTARKATGRHPAIATAARACMENLESRQMYSVSTNLIDGTLFVQGDDQRDIITIDHSGTTTFVNGKGVSDSLITKKIIVRPGDAPLIFEEQVVNVMANVRKVEIFGEGGDIITPPTAVYVNVGKNGSVQGIKGDVIFHGIGLSNQVLIDSSKDAVGRTATMNTVNRVTSISGLAPKVIRFDNEGVSAFDLKMGNGNDTVNVLDTFYQSFNILVGTFASNTFIDAGGGNDVVNVRGTTDEGHLHVEGTSGIDSVVIGENGSLARIHEDVDVTNSGGFTNLTVDDSTDATARTVTMARFNGNSKFFDINGIAQGVIGFNEDDINVLAIRGGKGGNKFIVQDTFKATSNTSVSQTVIDTGTGSDNVQVRRTTGGLTINGQAGLDIVNVSNKGSVQGIKGALFVSNPLGLTTLLVDESASTLPRVVTLSADVEPADVALANGRVNGIAPAQITYRLNDVKNLILSTGSGNDSFFVHATQVRTETLLNGGKGGDQFFVGSPGNNMNTIQRKVTMNGQDGTDLLYIMDKSATGVHTYTTFADRVERSGSAPVAFVSIEGLDVQKGQVLGSPPLVQDLTFTSAIKVGQYATVSGHLFDSDKSDKLTLTIDWGDGSKPTITMPGRDPFKMSHKYLTKGSYTVRVIWTDSTGQSNFRDLKLVVSA